jgi:hypothetical protein
MERVFANVHESLLLHSYILAPSTPLSPLPRSVTLIEAKELLGTFDGSLREYAARKLVRQGVKLRKVGSLCP